MKKFRAVIQSTVMAVFALSAHGQGAFQNLDFESATISTTQSPEVVNSMDALPNWNVFYGTNGPAAQMYFNAFILADGNPPPWVALSGTNGLMPASIEGNFSVYLTGREVGTPGEADAPAGSIGQTGLVPTNAESILFKAQSGSFAASFTVTLNGQNISYVALETEPTYTLYGGDISAFAGQTSDLAFTAGLYGSGWNLDSIEFSDQPVPEPSTFSLGGLALGLMLIIGMRNRVKMANKMANKPSGNRQLK